MMKKNKMGTHPAVFLRITGKYGNCRRRDFIKRVN